MEENKGRFTVETELSQELMKEGYRTVIYRTWRGIVYIGLAVLSFGIAAYEAYDAWHSAVPCEMCGTLEAAVAAASRDARPGEAVLLSPGAASFDQFKNFGARGDRFAALVMKERQKNEC